MGDTVLMVVVAFAILFLVRLRLRRSSAAPESASPRPRGGITASVDVRIDDDGTAAPRERMRRAYRDDPLRVAP
ncbi:MAG: hypothetical protein ACRELD_07890 [Longimicrobiales bacterium]